MAGTHECGSYMEFGCGPGWELNGDRRVQCVNGQWAAPLPTCINRNPGKVLLFNSWKHAFVTRITVKSDVTFRTFTLSLIHAPVMLKNLLNSVKDHLRLRMIWYWGRGKVHDRFTSWNLWLLTISRFYNVVEMTAYILLVSRNHW